MNDEQSSVAAIGKVVAIAQPTFLPWLGWFDLMDQADIFILLDDVAFSKQSWQQRNRIQTAQGLAYVTVPVRTAGRLGQRIIETELSNTGSIDKLVRTISANYSRAIHFRPYFPEFQEVIMASAASGKLVELNIACIAWLAGKLGIETPCLRSSELGIDGKRGEYVARLCGHVGSGHYLSPAGAEAYLVEDAVEFSRRSIRVELQQYEHPVYSQCFKPFQAYASVIDLLFNKGEASLEIIRSGRRKPRGLEIHPALGNADT